MKSDTDILTILSRKGGAGKSTLAVHLAVGASSPRNKVVIIDIDPQASASTWGALREALGRNEFPVVIKSTPDKLQATIDAAKASGVGLIIIDTAPHIHADSLGAAKAADLILIPTKPNLFDLAAIPQTVEITRLARKPAKVVLNAVPPRPAENLFQDMAAAVAEHDLTICPLHLVQRADYAKALESGHAVQEHRPKGKAAREVKALWNWVRTELNMIRQDKAAQAPAKSA